MVALVHQGKCPRWQEADSTISLKKSCVKKINAGRLFYFYFKNYIISKLKNAIYQLKHIFLRLPVDLRDINK